MERVLLLIAISGAIATTGCAGEAWYVDGRFTPAEFAEIRRGADLWTDAGFPVDLVPGQAVSGLPSDRKEIFRVDARMLPGVVVGSRRSAEAATAGNGRRIAIAMENLTEPLWHVAAHEFGHSLDLSHVADESAVMGTSGPMIGCLTPADLDELCRVHGHCSRRTTGCDE